MTENRVVSRRPEGEIDDPLTEILRSGARRLIAQAVEAEIDAFVASHAALTLPDGRQRIVRHGHDPVRTIQTGIGPVEVEKPKARDRGAPDSAVCDGAASHGSHEGRSLAGHGASHGLQAGDGRGEKLATAARPKSVAESRQRCNIPRRNRSRTRSQSRRLIHAVTENPA